MRLPHAQNQCAERAGHPVQHCVGAAHCVDPVVDRVRRAGVHAGNTERRLERDTCDEAFDARFCGNTPSRGAGYAIGKRRDQS
jgi:hypothetical protein